MKMLSEWDSGCSQSLVLSMYFGLLSIRILSRALFYDQKMQ